MSGTKSRVRIQGYLLVYSVSGLLAYENGVESRRTVVLVGGLGDRMMSLSYTQDFLDLCAEHRIRLVVPELTSYPNFQTVAIDQDIEDINDLLGAIEGEIVLVGHSTGCQDILLYMERYSNTKVKGLVLQGPVSDIECLPEQVQAQRSACIADFGRTGHRFVEIDGVIWLKERFATLFTRRGKEDLFSSYLDDEDFARWRRVPARILSVVSENDEYCTRDVCKQLQLMGNVHVVRRGTHGLGSEENRKDFISAVSLFLRELNFV